MEKKVAGNGCWWLGGCLMSFYNEVAAIWVELRGGGGTCSLINCNWFLWLCLNSANGRLNSLGVCTQRGVDRPWLSREKKRNETRRKEKGRVKPIFTRPPVCGMSRSLLRTIPAHLLVGFSVDLFACWEQSCNKNAQFTASQSRCLSFMV